MSDRTPPAWAGAMEGRLLSAVEAMRADMATRADVASAVDALRADMATRRNVDDIMARIDRLQEDLTRQRDSGVVELGTAEMALRKNDNTRGDVQTLTDMVLALTRQVRRMDAELRQLRDGGAT
jgi:hypothetical protein